MISWKIQSLPIVSAISALSSHVNDVKSDSRENNIECLISGLNGINGLYGKKLQFSTLKEFNEHRLMRGGFKF